MLPLAGAVTLLQSTTVSFGSGCSSSWHVSSNAAVPPSLIAIAVANFVPLMLKKLNPLALFNTGLSTAVIVAVVAAALPLIFFARD